MPEISRVEAIAGLSLKAILITLIGLLLFGIYVGILIYGENSLTVLNRLNEKKEMLRQEEKSLKAENQKLQKALFELKQLEPKE